jgi:hypothetical protein
MVKRFLYLTCFTVLCVLITVSWDTPPPETRLMCDEPKDNSAAEINAYNSCMEAQQRESDCVNGWNGYRSCR